MILTALLFGAAVIAGAGIVAAFWNDLVAFLKKAVEKVRAVVAGIVYGTKVFIRKIGEAFKEISRNYSKVDDHWQETIVTREIPASKVPEDILARANEIGYGQELDITDELEMQLESAYRRGPHPGDAGPEGAALGLRGRKQRLVEQHQNPVGGL